jgi:putative ABC transport system ATP-binding protein
MIELVNLGKDYPEAGRPRPVLRGVHAVFADGEFVAIRGRSGSGKTTLLNLIAGLDTPTAGEVRIDGTVLTALPSRQRTLFRRRHIGFVFQFFNLIPTLTVLENVLLPADLAGSPAREARQRADDLLVQVGLDDRAADFPDRLSGGEQQRVAIARGLIQEPSLVLADEPTGNLDEATGESVMTLLEGMTHQLHKTLVLVTHSHRIASRADRMWVVEHAQLVPASAEPMSPLG